jgi:hypothetical protein
VPSDYITISSRDCASYLRHITLTIASLTHWCSVAQEAYQMWHSVPIEVDGSIVGAAVRQENGVRFIATDLRVAEMDQTLWPAAADVLRAAKQMLRTGRIPKFNPPSIED